MVGALKTTADLLELLNENAFKVNSYRAAARSLEGEERPVEELQAARFAGVPKIGTQLGAALTEYLETGTFGPLEEAASLVPPGVLSIFRVRGLGPKKIRALWEAGIESLEDLREACRNGRVAAMRGFGAKSQENILEGVEFALRAQGRQHLSTACTVADGLLHLLEGLEARVAGSLRRGLEAVGDVEVTVTAERDTVRARLEGHLENLHEAADYPAWQGEVNGVPVEVGYAPAAVRGALDLMFSGKAYQALLQQRAQQRGLELSSRGLMRAGEALPAHDEQTVLAALELPHLPAPYRETEHLALPEHEIAALPPESELIRTEQIRGMLHVHSSYSDGVNSVREMADEVRRLGQSYLGMGDHSVSAYYANGLSPERLRAQMQEIDALRGEGYAILKGAEVDILEDGSLDYDDDLLSELDYVVASVHSHFTLPAARQTERLIRAVSHPLITILGHPTGRLMLRRPPYALDLDAVLEAAAARGTVIEINANAYRLDLDWREALRWRNRLRFAINTDAHVTGGLRDVRYGVMVARKAGLTAAHVVNTLEQDAFLEFVRAQRAARG
nr:DNA polymerase/3'-5' exonuclease PolX [Deinobacterium chartae]